MPQIVGSPWGDVPFPDDMSEEEIDRQMLEYAKAQHSMGNVSATRSLSSSYDNPMRARVPPPPPPPSNTGPTGINFNQDEALVRQQIQMIPDEATRVREMNAWQDYVVKQTHDQAANIPRTGNPFKDIASGAGGLAQAGLLIDDTVRAGARGVPFVGPFMDELAAKTSGGGEENTAYQHARDRYFDREAPIQSGIAQFAGGTAGSLAGGGLARSIGGAFFPAKAAQVAALPAGAKIGLGAATGAASGAGQVAAISAGNAEGGVGPRLQAAAENWRPALIGALAGGAAGTIGPTNQAYIQHKYPTGNASQGVDDALRRQNINLPYFARATDKATQDKARDLARTPTRLGNALNDAYATGADDVSARASNIVRDTAGATPPTAPHASGAAIRGVEGVTASGTRPAVAATGLYAQREGINRAQDITGNQLSRLLPDDASQVNVTMPNTANEARTIIRDNRAGSSNKPGANLQQATRAYVKGLYGEHTWPGALKARSDYGRMTRTPVVAAVETSEQKELANRLYPHMTEDLRRTATRQGQGPAFDRLNAQYEALTTREKQLVEIIKTAQDPEALIHQMASAATTSGKGTAIEDLRRVVSFLPPALQERLGGGVLGHAFNQAQGNPAALAARIGSIPAENRQLLFPGQMAGNVADIETIGNQLYPLERARLGISPDAPPSAIEKVLTEGGKAGTALALGGPVGAGAYLVPKAWQATAGHVGAARRRMQLLRGDMTPSMRRAAKGGRGIAATVGAAARTGVNLTRDELDEKK